MPNKPILKKAGVTRRSRVIRIDPRKLDCTITLPAVEYEVTVTPVAAEEDVYTGPVIPMPVVLMFCLTPNELRVAAVVLHESCLHGDCRLAVTEIARRLAMTAQSVSSTLYSLRKQGLLKEYALGAGGRGGGYVRSINFGMVQGLARRLEGEDPGVYARLRRGCRTLDRLTGDDIRDSYDNTLPDPKAPPEEHEEYD